IYAHLDVACVEEKHLVAAYHKYVILCRRRGVYETFSDFAFHESPCDERPNGPETSGRSDCPPLRGLIQRVIPSRCPQRQHYTVVLGFGLTDSETRSEEHTSELQSRENLVCRLL